MPLVLVTMAVAAAMGDLAAGETPCLDWRRTVARIPAVAGAIAVVILVQAVLILTVVGVSRMEGAPDARKVVRT